MSSPSGRVYSTIESHAIDSCLGMLALLAGKAGNKQLKRVATFTRMETWLDEATNLMLGLAEAEVRASPQEISAFMLDLDSRFFQVQEAADTSLARAEVLQQVNPHHTIGFYRYKTPGISDRTALISTIAKQVAEDPPTFVVAVCPIPSHDKIDRKDEAGAIRLENHRSFRLTEVAPGTTRLEYVCSIDLKGWVPQSFTNAVVIPKQTGAAQNLQRYFQQIRPLSECDARDGRVVGHMLMELVDKKPKELALTIRTFATRTAMLRECGCCMGDMLIAMLAASANSGSEHAPPAVAQLAAQDPASVTAEQATAIGRMLATRTRSSHVPATALSTMVDSHSIVRTMKTKHSWFVPMLEVLLVPPESAELRRPSVMRRLSAIITPEAMAHDVSNANFDSVVRPIRAAPHHRSPHPATRHTRTVGVCADADIGCCKRCSECLGGAGSNHLVPHSPRAGRRCYVRLQMSFRPPRLLT